MAKWFRVRIQWDAGISGSPWEGTEEGTDRWAVENGFVSITPLRLDLTNEKELAQGLTRHPLA